MNSIEIYGLTKRYGDVTAVDGLSLTVEAGECLALLGVNGAGKTTALRMLSGLAKPDGGDARLTGFSVVKETQSVKEVIALSPQESAVAQNLTVRENLELMAGVCGAGRKHASERAWQQIRNLGLEEVSEKRAGKLSGGWQRRLSIAMALIQDPRILFLDEPTLGLDVLARRELWNVVRGLKGKITILLTTHYLEEAIALSDRIAIMNRGKLKAVGTADALMHLAGCSSFEDAFAVLATEEEGR